MFLPGSTYRDLCSVSNVNDAGIIVKRLECLILQMKLFVLARENVMCYKFLFKNNYKTCIQNKKHTRFSQMLSTEKHFFPFIRSKEKKPV